MRRSAAPSQLQAAKRTKFTAPYKMGHIPDSLPAISHLPALSTSMAVAVQGDISASVTPINTIPLMSAQASSTGKVLQKFCTPNFISKRTDAHSTEEEQVIKQKCLIPSRNVRGKSDNKVISKFAGRVDDEIAQSIITACDVTVNEPEGKLSELDVGNQEDTYSKLATGDRALGVQKEPVKPCSMAKRLNFQSPLTSKSPQNVNNFSQSTVSRMAVSTVNCHGPDSANSEEDASPGYFSVVWCKLSKKKHKKWEGDAILVTHGRHGVLYDLDGKEIGKSSSHKISELGSLTDDQTLIIGGKEIQIMARLNEQTFKSGKCFNTAGSITGDCNSVKNPTSGQFKPFKSPSLAQKGDLNMELSASRGQTVNVMPKFNPLAPDALVMPRPTSAYQRQHNTHQSVILDVVVDPHLSYHLRPHQRDGVIFLYECVTGMRNYGGTGAILADEMGLGKTLQCISLIWTLLKQGPFGGKPFVKKVLIITPGSLVKNWMAEFRKWLGQERLQVFAVTDDNRVEDYVKTAVYPVLIISYEMFVRSYEVVKKISFDLVVCDEGHRLKNTTIKTTSLINSLNTRRRIVLSGTPIQNDLQEFFAVVDFCNPSILGTSSAFRRVYEKPILMSGQPGALKEVVELGEDRAAELSHITRKFILRRTQEINNKYLPPKETFQFKFPVFGKDLYTSTAMLNLGSKVELVLFCRPSQIQIKIYREILRSKVVHSCLIGRDCKTSLGTGSSHLLAIAALKQICNHPNLIAPKVFKTCEALAALDDAGSLSDGDSLFLGLMEIYQEKITREAENLEHSGKLSALAVILANIFMHCPQEKVVLVSNHTKTLDLLQKFCSVCGYAYVRLDGHTPTALRQQIVTRFNSSYGQEKVFLLSSKAGGVGLNLVGASRLFLYDIDWNPANDLQAMARVWRDGQKKQVFIYRLLTTGTLEEKVYQRQISKQGLSGAVMDLKASDIQFSTEDLKDLFSFNEGTECETHDLLCCQCDSEDGFESEHHLSATVLSPSCQQGDQVLPKKTCNLSMAELMDWQHLRGSSSHIEKDWCLENTSNSVSFIFGHKTSQNNNEHC